MSRRRESYLWRKSSNSSFYFRCLIPRDLLPVLRTRTIVLSLQSGILQESKSLSRNLYCYCQEIFSRLRVMNGMGITIEEIKSLLRNENLRFKSVINNYEQMKNWTKDEISNFLQRRISSMKEDTFNFELELRSDKKQKQREKDIDRFLKGVEKEFSEGDFK